MNALAEAAPMHTIVDAIAERRGGTGALTVIDGDRGPDTVGWSEVHDRARRMATVLRRHGIGPSSRVGLLADTSVDLIQTMQAVWLAGAAVTVLAPPARAPSDTYLRQCAAVVADARLDLVVLADPHAAMVLPAATARLATLVAAATAAEPMTPVAPPAGALAILQYTSGSTRDPRGVPVTHGHLAANLSAIRVATRHESVHACQLSWLPLYHDLGLIGSLALPMSCGCRLILQTTPTFARRPASWFAAISRYRATATAAPNFAYQLMTRLLSAGLDVDLSSLRFMVTGAEPIDAVMMARFAAVAGRHGLDPSALVPAYGLAESTLAVTFSPVGAGVRVDAVDPLVLQTQGRAIPAGPGVAPRRLVRLGGPVPGTSIRVVDPRTSVPVHSRHVGRVEIRGPSVVGHYWGQAPASADGWLATGDLGYLTDGELVVCGRESERLFAAGRNLYPQDVEAAAADATGVRIGGVVAFGVPGAGGERFVVAVESRASEASTVRRVVADAVLAEVGVAPAAVLTVPFGRLPRTSSGKPRRAEARRRHLLGNLVPPERTPR